MIYKTIKSILARIAAIISGIFQAQLFVHKPIQKEVEAEQGSKGEKFTQGFLRPEYAGNSRKNTWMVLFGAMMRVTVYLLLALVLFGVLTSTNPSKDDKPTVPNMSSITGIHFE